MMRLVYGVGVNDVDYTVTQEEVSAYVNGGCKRKTVWTCPFYLTWRSMLRRCFSDEFKTKCPTYKDVTCCEEWLLLSNFRRWMETQDWKGKQLDKDIIITGNSVYSPEACAFVSNATNSFVIASSARRGKWPLGVSRERRRNKYRADCSDPFTGKREFIGNFNTPEEAHEAWRKRKYEYAQLVAATESDPRVVEALKERYSFEEWYGNEKEG